MGRGRGKDGQFEEEDNSVRARLGRLIELGETMRATKTEEEAALQARERARTDPVKDVKRGERRAGVTVTLALSAIDALERLSTVSGLRRGYVLDDLITAAAKEMRAQKDGDE